MTTQPLPAEVRTRLSKLLPMLSASPGEAANAAAAINRTLQAHGLDIHSLTDAITSEPKPAAAAVVREPAPAPAFHLYERADGSFEIPEPQLADLLGQIRGQVYLSQWEDDFLLSFEGRCFKYSGNLIFVSEKQLNIITRLLQRVPA